MAKLFDGYEFDQYLVYTSKRTDLNIDPFDAAESLPADPGKAAAVAKPQ